ncbi:hypothetical protein [Streptosporangium lutulentum]|uniref:Toxin-antitoxin system HicB family antitoxin n=1 Tax=Streptosporangium lutulentum TaxID=1461250 RepID=A0ABT9QUB2_9ACTN|nr:hypothetical protein [Streptosporangium lutulentum]MDP9850334.1 hypothetical protein [Streptosporangium lutulentum]
MILTMATHGATGARRGERRRKPSRTKGSAEPWDIRTTLTPFLADKLLDLCDATGLSANALLSGLVDQVPVDPETGRPQGWAANVQETMPIAS